MTLPKVKAFVAELVEQRARVVSQGYAFSLTGADAEITLELLVAALEHHATHHAGETVKDGSTESMKGET